MTRKEFLEWLNTHPTSQWTIMDVDEDCNRVKVLFWFDEEESIKEEEAVK